MATASRSIPPTTPTSRECYSIGNSSCTGSGAPEPCCTGAGTGACIAFPTLNAFQSTLMSTIGNAFVAKLNPSASGTASLLYSTYFGGSSRGHWLRYRGRFLRQRLCHGIYVLDRKLQLHRFGRA